MQGLIYFRSFQTIHVDKDIGALAYYLKKNSSVTNCNILTNFPSEVSAVRGVRIWELLYNIRKSDFLILYHFTIETLFLCIISYIFFKKTKIIIKADLDTRYLECLEKSRQKFVFRTIVHLSNTILIETDTYRQQIVRHSKTPKKFFSLYNGSKLMPLRENTSERVTDLLIVGRWGHPQKNIPFILEILLRNPRIPKLNTIKIIGDPHGPNEVQNRRLLKLLDSKYQIDIENHISNNHLLTDEYLKTKVLLVPSLYESFGLVIAEAVLLGVRVISHNVGIAADLKKLTSSVNIALFQDEHDWVEKITEGLNHSDPVSIPAGLEDRFNWQHISNRLIKRIKVC